MLPACLLPPPSLGAFLAASSAGTTLARQSISVEFFTAALKLGMMNARWRPQVRHRTCSLPPRPTLSSLVYYFDTVVRADFDRICPPLPCAWTEADAFSAPSVHLLVARLHAHQRPSGIAYWTHIAILHANLAGEPKQEECLKK
ncbi:hypothetical protein K438DRAFT_2000258 [Mycena galopus ATCC 62051]|nr:hypothetical protein K438DRAFT_2000258 [Mycena galopus ATCC 62051]